MLYKCLYNYILLTEPVRRKNFIQENMKNLRRMEQCFRANKQVEDLQQLKLRKNPRYIDKYQNVSAKVITSFHEKKKHKDNDIELVTKNNIAQISSDKIENREEVQNIVNNLETDKKHDLSTKKIAQSGVNKTHATVDKQKRTNKHNNQQKLQSKILSGPNVSYKSDNDTSDAQSIITYRSQGIQTLDTDQIENIYSEGTIR